MESTAWIAVGPVRAGNGLLTVFGKPLAREGTDVARSEPLGSPVTEPLGGMLFFHDDHLQSSELNITESTLHRVIPPYRRGSRERR